MVSVIKVDKITGQSGKRGSAPITLSGDAVTLGTEATLQGTFSGTFSGDPDKKTCKAWANIDGNDSTPNIRDSFNVSSLTDHETGQIGVNFTTAMSNSTYVVSVMGGAMYGGNSACFDRSQTTFKAVTSSASSYVDANELDVLVFGD